MAPQIYASLGEALFNTDKVTRKPRSKRVHILDAAPTTTTTTEHLQSAKRARIGDESGGRSIIIWRIIRDHDNRDDWNFSFHRQSSPAAAIDAATSSASSALPVSSKKSTAIAEDAEDGRPSSKKHPTADGWRLPILKLQAMGAIDCNDGGVVRPLRKKITCSDIDRGQNRLLLPKETLNGAVFERMLTQTELAQAAEKSGLAVKVLNRMLDREYDLVLKFVGSIRAYRIMGRDYKKLVAENNFCVGRYLNLWLFRVPSTKMGTSADSELRMAVVVEGDDDEIMVEAEGIIEPAVVRAQERDEEDGPRHDQEDANANESGARDEMKMKEQLEADAVDALLLLQYAPPLR